MSNQTDTDPLTEPAVSVFVPIGITMLLAAVARLALAIALPEGPRGLKIKLEVVLCTWREGSQPITVTQAEVWFAYAAAAFLGIIAVTSIVVFFVAIGPMAHDVGNGLSLFSSVGKGNGLGIAALIVWLLSLVTAVVLGVRTVTIMRNTFLDPDFSKLVNNHFKQKAKGKAPTSSQAATQAAVDPLLPVIVIALPA